MKIFKLLFSVFVIAVFTCSNNVKGQTVQVYTTATVDGVAWCLNKPIEGYVTYHLTYHLDRKTGFVDRMHANIHKAEYYDKVTGERYIVIDVGNDNLGGDSWNWWNSPDNPGWDYDLPDNSIPVGPGPYPEDGINVWATLRLISKGGEMVYWHQVTRITVNAKGITTAHVEKYWEECNPDPTVE